MKCEEQDVKSFCLNAVNVVLYQTDVISSSLPAFAGFDCHHITEEPCLSKYSYLLIKWYKNFTKAERTQAWRHYFMIVKIETEFTKNLSPLNQYKHTTLLRKKIDRRWITLLIFAFFYENLDR